MSLPLQVVRVRPWWAPWRSLDMDRRAVLSALGSVFANVPDVAVSGRGGDVVADLTWLVTSGRTGDSLELNWQGRRIGSQWMVYAGERGIREVDVDVWDDVDDRPPGEFAAELRLLVEPLRELALTTGARFYADTGDMTDAPLAEIIATVTYDLSDRSG